MMMMIPEAWGRHTPDGPAPPRLLRIPRRDDGAVGRPGRRGLSPTAARSAPRSTATACVRPAIVTDDDHVVMPPGPACCRSRKKIVAKWRLQPGKMLLIDLEQGRIIDDEELKAPRPAQAFIASGSKNVRIKLDTGRTEPARSAEDPQGKPARPPAGLRHHQEDIKFLLSPMAITGEEAIGSMGNDSPLAVLSEEQAALQLLQAELFAQGDQPADRPDPRGHRDVAGPSSGPSPTCWTSTR